MKMAMGINSEKLEPETELPEGIINDSFITNKLLYSIAISCKRMADIQERFEKNLKKDLKYD